MAARTWNQANFLTDAQRLDHAVTRYWTRRFPQLLPGQVLIIDRTPTRPAKAA